MLLKKKVIFLTGILSTLLFAAGSSFAGPPVGSLDESYYEGIWNFRITEKCNRATDAGVVSLPLQNVYMTLKWDGAVYRAKVYPTIADARWETNGIGETVFSFDLPWPGEFYVSDVEGSVDRDHPKFNGSCELKLVVCLKTAVNNSKNPLLSKMSGWGIAYCESDDTDSPLLKCKVTFLGKWVEALQSPSGCQTNADCASGYYCENEPGYYGGVGACYKARSCTLDYRVENYSRFEAVNGDNWCTTDEDCMVSGCSGEICAAESFVSTCEVLGWTPDEGGYACRCVKGVCHWNICDN